MLYTWWKANYAGQLDVDLDKLNAFTYYVIISLVNFSIDVISVIYLSIYYKFVASVLRRKCAFSFVMIDYKCFNNVILP